MGTQPRTKVVYHYQTKMILISCSSTGKARCMQHQDHGFDSRKLSLETLQRTCKVLVHRFHIITRGVYQSALKQVLLSVACTDMLFLPPAVAFSLLAPMGLPVIISSGNHLLACTVHHYFLFK